MLLTISSLAASLRSRHQLERREAGRVFQADYALNSELARGVLRVLDGS